MRKVVVLGAAGGIGQPLSLLLALEPQVSELSLYDVAPVTPGVGVDISHINTRAKVVGYGKDKLEEALQGAEVVIIPAGMPRKPGMTRQDLFNTNATIVMNLATACAKVCPKALVGVIANPVNSTVPIVAEVYKKAGVYDKNRLFGITTLDVVRAAKFVGEAKKQSPTKMDITVIGGHSGITIIPVLSQARPSVTFSPDELEKMTKRIQEAGTEVVNAKAGGGSATLSMAYAGARFTKALLNGLDGKPAKECAYVESTVVKEVTFFATPIEFGPTGLKKNLGLPTLSEFEQAKLKAAIPELVANIKEGVDFVAKAK